MQLLGRKFFHESWLRQVEIVLITHKTSPNIRISFVVLEISGIQEKAGFLMHLKPDIFLL